MASVLLRRATPAGHIPLTYLPSRGEETAKKAEAFLGPELFEGPDSFLGRPADPSSLKDGAGNDQVHAVARNRAAPPVQPQVGGEAHNAAVTVAVDPGE